MYWVWIWVFVFENLLDSFSGYFVNNLIEAYKACVWVIRNKLQSTSHPPIHHHLGEPVGFWSVVCCISCGECASGFWGVLSSLMRFKISPSSHRLNLRCRQEMWSCALDLACGFCSISEGHSGLQCNGFKVRFRNKAVREPSKFGYKLLAPCSKWYLKEIRLPVIHLSLHIINRFREFLSWYVPPRTKLYLVLAWTVEEFLFPRGCPCWRYQTWRWCSHLYLG